MVLATVVLNIKRSFFCNRVCPFGTLQTLLFRLSRKKIPIPNMLQNLKYLSIIFLGAIITLSFHADLLSKGIAGITVGEIAIAKMKIALLVFFILSILMSIFSYRFFCYVLCPIRALSNISELPLKKRKGTDQLA